MPGSSPPSARLARFLAFSAVVACGDPGGVALKVDDDVGVREGGVGGQSERKEAGTGGSTTSDADSREDELPAPIDGPNDASPHSEAGPPPDAAGPADLTVVTLNVGTPNLADPVYFRHISQQTYEDFIGQKLRALDADLVSLQEVLPAAVCLTAAEADPARACFDAAARPSQAERLLGPDYLVVCDTGRGTTCLGVHRRIGLPPSAVRQTRVAPLPSCSLAANTCDEQFCDEDSAVNRIDLSTSRGPVTVIFFLLNAPGRGVSGFYTGQACRAPQVDQLFDAALTPPGGTPLLLGSLAFDPDSPLAGDAGTRYSARLAPLGMFRDLAPRDEAGRRVPTVLTTGGAEDTALATAFSGSCDVVGEPTFDLGFDFQTLPGGEADRGRLDHRPVRCRLNLP